MVILELGAIRPGNKFLDGSSPDLGGAAVRNDRLPDNNFDQPESHKFITGLFHGV
jgi:hypothetical protein